MTCVIGAWPSAESQGDGGGTSPALLTRFETNAQRTMPFVRYYKQRIDQVWLDSNATSFTGSGHTLVLSSKFRYSGGTYSWAQVGAGSADAAITARAAEMAAYGNPIYISFHHEPENDVGTAGGGTPAEYNAMWRRCVDIFRANGATNVIFSFILIGYPSPRNLGYWPVMYPGNSYIDWIGFDPYVWTPQKGPYDPVTGLPSSFISTVDNFRNQWAQKYHPDKPIMMAEWGINEGGDDGTIKASMYPKMIICLENRPDVQMLLYFNSGSFRDGLLWWTESSQKSLDAWATMANDPFFSGTGSSSSGGGTGVGAGGPGPDVPPAPTTAPDTVGGSGSTSAPTIVAVGKSNFGTPVVLNDHEGSYDASTDPEFPNVVYSNIDSYNCGFWLGRVGTKYLAVYTTTYPNSGARFGEYAKVWARTVSWADLTITLGDPVLVADTALLDDLSGRQWEDFGGADLYVSPVCEGNGAVVNIWSEYNGPGIAYYAASVLLDMRGSTPVVISSFDDESVGMFGIYDTFAGMFVTGMSTASYPVPAVVHDSATTCVYLLWLSIGKTTEFDSAARIAAFTIDLDASTPMAQVDHNDIDTTASGENIFAPSFGMVSKYEVTLFGVDNPSEVSKVYTVSAHPDGTSIVYAKVGLDGFIPSPIESDHQSGYVFLGEPSYTDARNSGSGLIVSTAYAGTGIWKVDIDEATRDVVLRQAGSYQGGTFFSPNSSKYVGELIMNFHYNFGPSTCPSDINGITMAFREAVTVTGFDSFGPLTSNTAVHELVFDIFSSTQSSATFGASLPFPDWALDGVRSWAAMHGLVIDTPTSGVIGLADFAEKEPPYGRYVLAPFLFSPEIVAPPLRMLQRDDSVDVINKMPRINVIGQTGNSPSSFQEARTPRIFEGGNTYQ